MRLGLAAVLAVCVLAVSLYVGRRFPPLETRRGEPAPARVVDDDLDALDEYTEQVGAFAARIKRELDRKAPAGSFTGDDADALVGMLEHLKEQLWVLQRRGGGREAPKFEAGESLRARALTRAVALRPALGGAGHGGARRRDGLVALEADLRTLHLQLRGLQRVLADPEP